MANDFASMFEKSPQSAARGPVKLAAGQLIEGTVLAISGGLVVVDIGSSADASIDVLEFEGRTVEIGSKIKATVSNPRKDGPILTLSLGKGGSAVNVNTLELAMQGRTPVSGHVSSSNKGGYTVDVAGIRTFCPISQIDAGFVTDPEIFVGQTLDFLVTEIREGGRNVVVSRRKLLQDERRSSEDQLVSALNVGALVSGTVKKIVQHGAVLDLGGIEGFIPISELSSSRIDKADDVVSIGETVEAQVLSIERTEKGLNVRLSVKALNPERQTAAAPSAQVDEILDGKVIKHVPGGLIITTPKGEGLVPTRELTLAPGADHRRSYPVDTEIKVVVVSRDPTNGKLRFSVDRVAHVEERNNYRAFGSGNKSERSGSSMGSLGDLLAGKFGHLAASAKSATPASAERASTAERSTTAERPGPARAEKQPTPAPQHKAQGSVVHRRK